METWLAALVFAGLAVLIAVGNILGNVVLGVKAKEDLPTKYDTYECGEEPDGVAWARFHPRYYVIALVFVLFDVETVFVLPWALNIRSPEIGGLAVVEMFIFIGILLLGWVYALRKGALEWQ